jgi:UDP-GlcNAc3NAcA epimerase
MIKIVTIVGARPQFIKAAILRRLFKRHKAFTEILVHTGQHYDSKMSDIFFKDLEIDEPEYHFNINGKSHGQMTGEMLSSIEEVLIKERPNACLVYGDTNSTLAGALAASKLHIPVIHVEAGLRSFNKLMPEEINRILTDHLSNYLFCSTEMAVKNLLNENIKNNVFEVGDIMYDAVLFTRSKSQNIKSIQGVNLEIGNLAACTIHRAENTDNKKTMIEIIDYLNSYSDKYNIILPLHPRTKNSLETFNLSFGNVTTIDPIGYMEMQALLSASDLVFTDSGGLQKEAYFHGVKCVTLRNETEWIELIDNGWNRLWKERDYLDEQPIHEYGDGTTGAKILKCLEKSLL